jgi:LmbE family N-acetylglucosaminyl deacetylase
VENVDILTIAAHPDDIELTCAGTLLKMVDRGYSVGILDLTQGELGTRGTPEIRAKEAASAAAVIGARFRTRLNFGDARLTASIENRMALAEAIRVARPKTVILPYWEGPAPRPLYRCDPGLRSLLRRRIEAVAG